MLEVHARAHRQAGRDGHNCHEIEDRVSVLEAGLPNDRRVFNTLHPEISNENLRQACQESRRAIRRKKGNPLIGVHRFGAEVERSERSTGDFHMHEVAPSLGRAFRLLALPLYEPQRSLLSLAA